MGWDGKDKRGHKRYGVRDSTVVFRKGGFFAFAKPASPTYLLLNLSVTGCHFICREELAIGTRLFLTIDTPAGRSSIRARGVTVWARRSDAQDAWHIGVTFTKVGARSKNLLKNLLDGAILDNIEISTRAYMKQIEKL